MKKKLQAQPQPKPAIDSQAFPKHAEPFGASGGRKMTWVAASTVMTCQGQRLHALQNDVSMKGSLLHGVL